MKKITKHFLPLFSIILSIIIASIIFSTIIFNVSAATIINSGSSSNGITWQLDNTGTLHIQGTGAMPDVWYPWSDNEDSIKKVIIANGITNISGGAFNSCSQLASVTIPNSVTSIGSKAFAFCRKLENVTLPNNLISIGTRAFYDCTSLKTINIPNSVKTIGENAFSSCSALTSATLSNNITTIEKGTFDYCYSLTSITIPSSVKSIGEAAFGSCGFISITIPSSVTTLGDSAFSCCTSLKSITIPNSITSIGYMTFVGCSSLASITLPNGLTSIGMQAFGDCSSLTNITIPANVNSIGYYAFESCSSLSSITFNGSAPTIESNSFANVTTNAYYSKASWSSDKLQNYGGKINWINLSVNSNDSSTTDGYSTQTTPNSKPNQNTSQNSATTNSNQSSTDKNNSQTPSNPNDNTQQNTSAQTDTETTKTTTCRLEDLKSIDYLAFADIAYVKLENLLLVEIGDTVYELITENLTINDWGKPWKSTDILYSELFEKISNWKVLDYKINDKTGFASYAFVNDYNEVVISYRGSISLEEYLEKDWWNDWIKNDINMYFGGNGAQVEEALDFAYEIINNIGKDSVAITGHSLGGGLCDIVSARYNCYAESFNAAPFLTIAYQYYPEIMAELFTGVENWQFIDHITIGDTLVGEMNLWQKNYRLHTAGKYTNGEEHLLPSLIKKQKDGTLSLTNIPNGKQQNFDNTIAGYTSALAEVTAKYITLGTTKDDQIFNLQNLKDSFGYGGNGADKIIGGIKNDILVGGKGTDYIDGGRGNDKYYYFKGDGLDFIFDISGKDELHLMNFSATDNITVSQDKSKVDIICNREVIVRISRDRNRSSSFKVIINGETRDLTSMFNPKSVSAHMTIACPVNVEIIEDATGKVVHTMYDNKKNIGANYTDYGYLYIYEENGELVKSVDLFEGYSARIVGTDKGKMNVVIHEETGENEYKAIGAVNVPVVKGMVANVITENDIMYLQIDNENDGTLDDKIKLDTIYTVTFDANDGTGTMYTAIVSESEFVLPECSFTAPDGLSFKAWCIEGKEYAVGDTYNLTKDITVNAVWDDSNNIITNNSFIWIIIAVSVILIIVGIVAIILIKKKKLLNKITA